LDIRGEVRRHTAYKEGNRVSLLSRNDKNRTKDFPDIVSAIVNLSPGTLLLDGEIVVFDSRRISRFQLLQQGKGPTQYAVFDCLMSMARIFEGNYFPSGGTSSSAL
jgi:ATP-dependent DNA ligase